MFFERTKNNPNLAERIFNYRTYQPYVQNCSDRNVRKMCWECNNIQESLLKAIEVCGEPNTPQARYVYAICYAYSRKEYNEKAIYYLNYYLNNPLYEDIYLKRRRSFSNDDELERKLHICEMTNYLGQSYEKDKQLEKALECYKKCLQLDEEFQGRYLDIANIYRKMNKLDKSIEILNNAKNTKYYKKEFKEVIDRYITDYEDKIKKNYKYIPKSTKN